jgi:hypothetical protein
MNIQYLPSFYDIQKNKKVYVLLILIVAYTFLYMFLEDSHFKGVNKVQEVIEDEVIKEKVQQEIKENFIDFQFPKFQEEAKENAEQVIDETTKETQDDVKEKDLQVDSIKPTISQQFLNRLYFSITTGCLLGYGDIYPATNYSKILTMSQSLLTIALIVY